MAVVGVDGALGAYGDGAALALELPCGEAMPSAAVGGRVLEVAVLDEFAIESAIGSVADILKEDTDELVADGLAFLAMDGEAGIYGLEVGKAHWVLSHVLIELYLTVAQIVVALDEFVNLLPFYAVYLTLYGAVVKDDGAKVRTLA